MNAKVQNKIEGLRGVILRTSLALFSAAACSFILTSCGVRGRPEAPLTPPEIGRGEPGFKRASDEFKFPNVPSSSPTPAPRVNGSGDGH